MDSPADAEDVFALMMLYEESCHGRQTVEQKAPLQSIGQQRILHGASHRKSRQIKSGVEDGVPQQPNGQQQPHRRSHRESHRENPDVKDGSLQQPAAVQPRPHRQSHRKSLQENSNVHDEMSRFKQRHHSDHQEKRSSNRSSVNTLSERKHSHHHRNSHQTRSADQTSLKTSSYTGSFGGSYQGVGSIKMASAPRRSTVPPSIAEERVSKHQRPSYAATGGYISAAEIKRRREAAKREMRIQRRTASEGRNQQRQPLDPQTPPPPLHNLQRVHTKRSSTHHQRQSTSEGKNQQKRLQDPLSVPPPLPSSAQSSVTKPPRPLRPPPTPASQEPAGPPPKAQQR
jgi:hypothetical protein